MILPVVVYGHPALRKVSDEIDENYEGLGQLIDNMWETMYDAEGIGLAAPQIGKNIRLIVIDASPLAEEFPELEGFKKVMINPIITEFGDEECNESEGCLSLPGIREDVKRPVSIKIEYENENFELIEEELDGFAARVVQHEYDHVEAKLFIDHLSPLRKRLIKGKLNAITKGRVDVNYRIKTA